MCVVGCPCLNRAVALRTDIDGVIILWHSVTINSTCRRKPLEDEYLRVLLQPLVILLVGLRFQSAPFIRLLSSADDALLLESR